MPVQFAPPQGPSSFERALTSVGLIANLAQSLQQAKLQNETMAQNIQGEQIRQKALQQRSDLDALYGPLERQQGLDLGQANLQDMSARQQLLPGQLTLQNQQIKAGDLGYSRDVTQAGFDVSGLTLQQNLGQAKLKESDLNIQKGQQDIKTGELQNQIQGFNLDNLKQMYGGLRGALKLGYKKLTDDDRFAEQMSNVRGPAAVDSLNEMVHGLISEHLQGQQLQKTQDQLMLQNFHQTLRSTDGSPGDQALLNTYAKQLEPSGSGPYHDLASAATNTTNKMDLISQLYDAGVGGDPESMVGAYQLFASQNHITIPKVDMINKEGVPVKQPDYSVVSKPLAAAVAQFQKNGKAAAGTGSPPAPTTQQQARSPDTTVTTTTTTPKAVSAVAGGKTPQPVYTMPTMKQEPGLAGESTWTQDEPMRVSYKGSSREWNVQTTAGGANLPIVSSQKDFDDLPDGVQYWNAKSNKIGIK